MKYLARDIMKIAALLTVLAAIAARAPFAGSADKILPNPIEVLRLDNGLTVVTVSFDSPGLAAFYIVVDVGSRNETEKGVTGFAHFFEHMMFRGTAKYPNERYNEVLKSTGASANANTSTDRTIYHMTGNAAKLETMFELESDRFMNLDYSPHDFKTEAGAVKGEYTKNSSSPYMQLREKMLDAAFSKHPYKHTTMGFLADIIDMPNQYEYSKTFFRRYYRPEYTTIVVVGDVTPRRVNDLARKYFGTWKRGDYVPNIPAEPPQEDTRYVHVQNGAVPPILSLNYKGPAFSDKSLDMPALDVLSTLLFSPNSPLYKSLVIDERKVRFLGGGAFDSKDPNLFSIQAILVKKEDLQLVKDRILDQIEAVKQKGVDPKRLADTKSHLKYEFAMSIDNPDQVASSLCHYIALTGDPETINRIHALYDEVSAEELKRVASKYFVATGLTVATLSGDASGGMR